MTAGNDLVELGRLLGGDRHRVLGRGRDRLPARANRSAASMVDDGHEAAAARPSPNPSPPSDLFEHDDGALGEAEHGGGAPVVHDQRHVALRVHDRAQRALGQLRRRSAREGSRGRPA